MEVKKVKTMEKIILNFDQHSYEYATEMWNEKKALIESIKAAAKNQLELNIDVTDSVSLQQNIFNAVEKKFKEQNTLNLKGDKLVELMQIDLKPIYEASKLLSGYDGVMLDDKPTKEQFTISVDSEKELERYNLCQDAIKCIDAIRSVYDNVLPLRGFVTGFRGILEFNPYTEMLEPCIGFVKQDS